MQSGVRDPRRHAALRHAPASERATQAGGRAAAGVQCLKTATRAVAGGRATASRRLPQWHTSAPLRTCTPRAPPLRNSFKSRYDIDDSLLSIPNHWREVKIEIAHIERVCAGRPPRPARLEVNDPPRRCSSKPRAGGAGGRRGQRRRAPAIRGNLPRLSAKVDCQDVRIATSRVLPDALAARRGRNAHILLTSWQST